MEREKAQYWLIRMNVLSITTFIALLTLVQSANAQETIVSPTMDTTHRAVTAQISSPTNYSLLKPIESKPATVSSLLEPKSRPLVPMAVDTGATVQKTEAPKNSIEVSPLSFKSGVFDQHSFKIRNPTTKTLRAAKILLKAPAGSSVQQVIPKPDSVDGASILFSVGEMVPGEEQTIEVLIEYTRDELARFESIILSEKWAKGIGVVRKAAIVKDIETARPLASEASLLQPIKAKTSGMLKPKVPAMKVSATTKVSLEPLVPNAQDVKPLATESDVEPASSSNATNPGTSESLAGFAGVKSSLNGPSNAVVGQELEFSIDLKNYSKETANGVVVQLSIPQAMKVTVLDRAAWYDGKNRKISWKVDTLEPGAVELIRYKAVTKSAGSIEQSVVTGMNSQVESACALSTTAR